MPSPLSGPASISSYSEYAIHTEYKTHLGRLLLPVSPTTPQTLVVPSEIVQTNNPYTIKTVYWVAVRRGAHPVIPWPTSPRSNEVLIDFELYTDTPSVTLDASTVIFTVSGVYTYALYQPVFPTTGPIPTDPPYDNKPYFPKPPFHNFSDYELALTTQDFALDLIK